MSKHVCYRCDQIFKNFTHLEKHVPKCNIIKSDKDILLLQAKELELKCERMKCSLLKELLKIHTTIPIDNLFKEMEDGLHIYNYENGNVPIIVHSIIGDKGKVLNITNDKKERFKTITDKLDYDAVTIVASPYIETQKNSSEPEELKLPEPIGAIENLLDSLKTEKKYSKILTNIQTYITSHSSDKTYNEYLLFIKDIYDKTKNVLMGKNKKHQHLGKILSPLNSRILYFDKDMGSPNIDEGVNVDEIDNIKTCLSKKPQLNLNFFDKEGFIRQFKNYSICLFPIMNLLQIHITNYNQYIIYIPFSKSSLKDPYSFYTLAKPDNNTIKKWRMDCRLDIFSRELIEELRTFAIQLFRQIYHSVFKDNSYRSDFRKQSIVFEEEADQLIQNIYQLSKYYSFRQALCQIVIDNCTYKVGNNDKTNLTSDDNLLKQKFKNAVDTKDEEYISSKEMFDGTEIGFNFFDKK
jgi:hypothetical protein